MQHSSSFQLVWTIGFAVFARIALNTARRFAYPFAPALSRGMGVPLPAITSIVALNQGTGLLGFFLGPLADYFGYRRMMLLALSLLVSGMFAGSLFPFYGVIILSFALAGLGKTMFDPAIQAYIGSYVPYRRRGFMIGIIELGWAGSSLVGIPLMGVLIARLGWRAPFFALALWAGLSMIGVSLFIQKEACHSTPSSRFNIWNTWRQLFHERAALGMLCCGFFVNAANDALFVVYGTWMESTFGLSLVALGFSATAIGVAELSGEGLTAFLADRLGLHRAIMLGVSASGLSYVLLLLSGHNLPLALSTVFLIFIAVEFTIVSSLSLSTELLPDSRATMLAGYLAAANAGRVAGALIGGPLWLAGGILATGLFAVVFSGIGLLCFIWGLSKKPL